MATLMMDCEAQERASVEDLTIFMKLDNEKGMKNVARTKKMWQYFLNNDIENYLGFISADSFRGDVWSGIAPGGHNIRGKDNYRKFLQSLKERPLMREIKIVEPRDFGHSEAGDCVYWHVDYDMVINSGPFTGMHWKTTANGRAIWNEYGLCTECFVILNMPTTKKGVDINEKPSNWMASQSQVDDEMRNTNIDIVKKSVSTHQNFNEHEVANSPKYYHPADWSSQSPGFDNSIQNFLEFCHPEYRGEILSGILPGGANIEGVENLGDWMTSWKASMDAKRCPITDFGASEDGKVVYFTSDWDVEWKAGPYKGQRWVTTATSRKHIKDGKIWKDYYTMSLPHEVTHVATRG